MKKLGIAILTAVIPAAPLTGAVLGLVDRAAGATPQSAGSRMTPRTVFATVAALAVATVLIAGCGGGEETSGASTPKALAAPSEPPPQPAYVVPAPLKELERRLSAAGIPAPATGLVDGKAGLEVGRGVQVTYFADPEQAAKENSAILKIARNHPKNMVATAHGQIIAWSANQNGLTGKEREQFKKVAAALESLP